MDGGNVETSPRLRPRRGYRGYFGLELIDEIGRYWFTVSGVIFLTACAFTFSFAVLLFVVTAYFHENAARKVQDSDNDCTDMPSILNLFFGLEMLGWAIRAWEVKHAFQFGESLRESSLCFTFFDIFYEFIYYSVVLQGIRDYFELSKGCRSFIKQTGSPLLYTAFSVWVYYEIIIIALIFVSLMFCCWAQTSTRSGYAPVERHYGAQGSNSVEDPPGTYQNAAGAGQEPIEQPFISDNVPRF